MNSIKKIVRKIVDKLPYSTYGRSVYKSLLLSLKNGSNAVPKYSQLIVENRAVKKEVVFLGPSSPDEYGNDIIFTADSGVFIMTDQHSRIIQILRGKFYGITKYGDYWILARSNNYTPSMLPNDKSRRQSDICAIKLKGSKIIEYKLLTWGIAGEIHQIDIFEDKLFIPHTGFNQILYIHMSKLFKNGKPCKRAKTILSYRSIGLELLQPSHLNSLFFSSKTGTTYLIAHNSTAHTGRSSDILVFRENWCNMRIMRTKAHSAHNVCELPNGRVLYCDSNHWKLMLDEECFFEADTLLRGLSVTENCIFLGGSDIDFTGKKRGSSSCFIYILTHDRVLIATYKFADLGNIKEIRQFSCKDFAISS